MTLQFNSFARSCILTNIGDMLTTTVNLDIYPDTEPYPTNFSLPAASYPNYMIRFTGMTKAITGNKILWNTADASKYPLFNGTPGWARIYRQTSDSTQTAIFTTSISASDPTAVLQLSTMNFDVTQMVAILNFSFALN